MISMHKCQRNTKTTTYSIKFKNLFRIRFAGELTVCAISRWNPRQTSKISSDAKKKRIAVSDVSENLRENQWSKIHRKNWIATKRGAPYPHTATIHSMFFVCNAVSGAIVIHLFTFVEGNIKHTHFHIWRGRVFTLHLTKKNPKAKRKKTRC